MRSHRLVPLLGAAIQGDNVLSAVGAPLKTVLADIGLITSVTSMGTVSVGTPDFMAFEQVGTVEVPALVCCQIHAAVRLCRNVWGSDSTGEWDGHGE